MFILIGTCITDSSRVKLLERQVASVASQASAVGLQYRILLQGVAADDAVDFAFPDSSEVQSTVDTLPLSVARNRQMGDLFESAELEGEGAQIITFPDDDCWYPDAFLSEMQLFFEENPDVGMAFCRYSSRPEKLTRKGGGRFAELGDLFGNASSITIFLRASTLRRVGKFDESLGVGSRFGGGEDLDFAIRAFMASDKVWFFDQPAMGHPDRDTAKRAKYYSGNVRVVWLNFCRWPTWLWFRLLRAFGSGVQLVLMREVSVSGFAMAWVRALSR